MKLLVTGGAGFIGSNFILYWMKEHPDDEIVNLDKLTYAGNLENLKTVETSPRYKFVKGDIADPDDVRVAISGVNTVVHFAGETHVDRSILGPAAFVKTNVLGTQVLLDAAAEHQVKRFHHVSTDEVFGALSLDTKTKFSPKSPYDPRSPYPYQPHYRPNLPPRYDGRLPQRYYDRHAPGRLERYPRRADRFPPHRSAPPGQWRPQQPGVPHWQRPPTRDYRTLQRGYDHGGRYQPYRR